MIGPIPQVRTVLRPRASGCGGLNQIPSDTSQITSRHFSTPQLLTWPKVRLKLFVSLCAHLSTASIYVYLLTSGPGPSHDLGLGREVKCEKWYLEKKGVKEESKEVQSRCLPHICAKITHIYIRFRGIYVCLMFRKKKSSFAYGSSCKTRTL